MRFTTISLLLATAATTSQAFIPQHLKHTAFLPLNSEKTEVGKSAEKLTDAIEEHATNVRNKKLQATDEAVSSTLDSVQESAKDMKESVHDKVEDITSDDDEEGFIDNVKEKAGDAKDKVKDLAGSAKDKVKHAASKVKETVVGSEED